MLSPVQALLGWVALLSAAAFAACVADKARSVRGRARVRERTLLLLALAGGSPGLLAGMAAARHKTRKPSFLLKLGGVLALQVALVALAWPR